MYPIYKTILNICIFCNSFSDVEYTFDSDATDSADEGDDGVYDIPDEEETLLDDESIAQSTHTSLMSFGPHKKLSRGEEMYALKDEYQLGQDQKFICTLSLILAVFTSRCQTPGCIAAPTIEYHFVGTTLVVSSTCSSRHMHKFCSSSEVNNVFVNNLQTVALIMLSESHYAKVNRFAKFFNLEFVSKSTYYRFQRLYLIPEINDWWHWMKAELVKEFADKDIVVGGDGQCDSPGFNAKNLCYFMVEVNSNYILDIEVLDKRHVGLISTNMEKEAVK